MVVRKENRMKRNEGRMTRRKEIEKKKRKE